MRILSVLLACLALVPAARGQELSASAPCLKDPAFSAFDFWVGTWDVYAGDRLAGHNVITRQERGCLVHESWTSAGGATGQSYNVYNPQTDQWRQLWVSDGVLIDYTGGPEGPGTMVLEGTMTMLGDGTSKPFRGRWEAQEDGSVLQTFWTYEADEDEWVTWFEGTYRRAAG